nr:MAG TPA: HNH endonuclease [Bacteriophage sp.]
MRLCAWPGCRKPVEWGSRFCKGHEKSGKDRDERAEKEREDRRRKLQGNASERGYGSRWRKAAKTFLSQHPTCAECARQGKFTMATCVDHIVPHKGDRDLFWDKKNWQPLCQSCHSIKTASEDGGFGNKS